MRGDLLFYKGGGSIPDALIQWRTKGPFVHVEVDMGDGTAIGALSEKGVTKHPLRPFPVFVHLKTTPKRIEEGITWLEAHIGDPYGWADILDQVITLFLPKGWVITQQHGFDCSDLVCRYIELAGGLDLSGLPDDPALISPNDLARKAGLL